MSGSAGHRQPAFWGGAPPGRLMTARAPVAIVVGMESLGEDLLLLSIRPDRGRIGNADKIDFGLMGAELVRLAVLGRAEVAGERIAVVDAAPTGDAELDAALTSLAEAGRPPNATAWVGKPRHGIRGAYLARLAQAGVIQIEPTRFLGMPTGPRLHLIDGARLADARARLDAIALSSGPVDVTQAAYGGLAYATGLASLLYRGRDGRPARKRLAEVAKGGQSDAALGDVIEPGARQTVTDSAGEAGGEAATQAAVSAVSDAAVRGATDAVPAANDAAVQAAVQAANAAAVHAAVHAANHAASHAAAHAGGHAGGAGGHGH
jgi:Golgi phosphoprotein 3 GPP34